MVVTLLQAFSCAIFCILCSSRFFRVAVLDEDRNFKFGTVSPATRHAEVTSLPLPQPIKAGTRFSGPCRGMWWCSATLIIMHTWSPRVWSWRCWRHDWTDCGCCGCRYRSASTRTWRTTARSRSSTGHSRWWWTDARRYRRIFRVCTPPPPAPTIYTMPAPNADDILTAMFWIYTQKSNTRINNDRLYIIKLHLFDLLRICLKQIYSKAPGFEHNKCATVQLPREGVRVPCLQSCKQYMVHYLSFILIQSL